VIFKLSLSSVEKNLGKKALYLVSIKNTWQRSSLSLGKETVKMKTLGKEFFCRVVFCLTLGEELFYRVPEIKHSKSFNTRQRAKFR
jgi:hypothetical protein